MRLQGEGMSGRGGSASKSEGSHNEVPWPLWGVKNAGNWFVP